MQVRGLPVSIRRDPIPLFLDAQSLTLGSRGCLGRVKYLGYLFTCGKSSPDISYFVNLREQIISEENMVQSYFDIYNLLKINKIDRPKQNELI